MHSDKDLTRGISQKMPRPQVTNQLERKSFGTLDPSVDPRVVGANMKRDPSEGEPEEEKKEPTTLI